jgi:hypothetical protein
MAPMVGRGLVCLFALAGTMSKVGVDFVVRARLAAIKSCYEVELQKNPRLAGEIDVAWNIETDGRVSQARVVKSTMNDEKVEGCIVRQVSQWKFPPPAERTVVGRYPFVFKKVGAKEAAVTSPDGGVVEPSPASPPPAAPPTVRIWVSRTGVIELDGKAVDLAAVGAALADLAKKKGAVFYGREDPGQEPHPNAMKVVQLVIQNRLPIRLSTKRDFSDAVVPSP